MAIVVKIMRLRDSFDRRYLEMVARCMVTVIVFLIPNVTQAVVIGGVEFPSGNSSFADAVVSFVPGSYGGASSPNNDPSAALGIPGASTPNSVSLGNPNSALTTGILTVEFTDNLLVDQNSVENGLDLYIFEVGPVVEPFNVSISSDGINFISLGQVSGQPTGIDIAPFVNPGDTFRFVRIADARSQRTFGDIAGADIDAVGAIGSVNVSSTGTVPEPSSATLFFAGVIGLFAVRRRQILRKANAAHL